MGCNWYVELCHDCDCTKFLFIHLFATFWNKSKIIKINFWKSHYFSGWILCGVLLVKPLHEIKLRLILWFAAQSYTQEVLSFYFIGNVFLQCKKTTSVTCVCRNIRFLLSVGWSLRWNMSWAFHFQKWKFGLL